MFTQSLNRVKKNYPLPVRENENQSTLFAPDSGSKGFESILLQVGSTVR